MKSSNRQRVSMGKPVKQDCMQNTATWLTKGWFVKGCIGATWRGHPLTCPQTSSLVSLSVCEWALVLPSSSQWPTSFPSSPVVLPCARTLPLIAAHGNARARLVLVLSKFIFVRWPHLLVSNESSLFHPSWSTEQRVTLSFPGSIFSLQWLYQFSTQVNVWPSSSRLPSFL